MKVILPKEHVDIDDHPNLPLFFLAGPVLGGGDWQHGICQKLLRHTDGYIDDFFVAIPCRYEPSHPLQEYRAKSTGKTFERQTDWERYYLKFASQRGCIVFWLPCESKAEPRSDGLPYAMDTRGELGEWRGHLIHGGFYRVVFGAEPGFPGLSQIKRNFELALKYYPNFEIHEDMEELVNQALFKAKVRR